MFYAFWTHCNSWWAADLGMMYSPEVVKLRYNALFTKKVAVSWCRNLSQTSSDADTKPYSVDRLFKLRTLSPYTLSLGHDPRCLETDLKAQKTAHEIT